MPPAVQNNTASARRPTTSMRQRENRIHTQHAQPSTGAARRRKSRSPDTRVVEEGPSHQSDAIARRKKRPVTIAGPPSSSNLVNMGASRISVLEDLGDRGRSKVKHRSRPLTTWVDDDQEETSIVTNIVQDHGRSTNIPGARAKRKERSRSREAAHRHSRKTATPEPSEDEDDSVYTGPLAQAEYVRMKQEVEVLRKQMGVAKKTIGKQSKVIDELRAELTTTNESQRTQRAEMEKLKSKSKNSDDLIATVESNLTCQICLEVLSRPYGLSPCGHVLCMGCLQNWFKATPPDEDDMVDEDSPNTLLYRKKTCPCCRTVVCSRPIPLYLVKSLVSALDKAKTPAGAVRPSPPPEDGDPWAGIFRDPRHDYWSTDEDDDEDDEDDDDGEDDEQYDDDDFWSFDGYGTGDDDEQYDGPYVNPRWAPPGMYVSPDKYPYLDDYAPEMSILRRGATLEMIEIFHMTYEHDTGLCALVDGENEVYLGWNLELHPEDETGEEYMDWIVQDMWHRPERWRVVNDSRDGSWRAWKLVPEGEDDVFDNSDSEYYVDDMDEDEDM